MSNINEYSAVVIIAATVCFTTIFSLWKTRRTKQQMSLITPEYLAAQSTHHRVGWPPYAWAIGASVAGCLPLVLFAMAPALDGYYIAIIGVSVFLMQYLIWTHVQMLRSTYVDVRSEVVVYYTPSSYAEVPKQLISNVAWTQKLLVIETTDNKRICIPLHFVHNEIMCMQIYEISRLAKGSASSAPPNARN